MDGDSVTLSQEEGLSSREITAINVGGRVVEIFFPVSGSGKGGDLEYHGGTHRSFGRTLGDSANGRRQNINRRRIHLQ